jgi:hypothetical protein
MNYEFDHEDTRSEKCLDIWKDGTCMGLLTKNNFGSKTCDLIEKEKAK